MQPSDTRPDSHLTLDALRQFDLLALTESDDMFLHVVPKRSNTPVKGEAAKRGDWDTPMQIHGWRWAQGYDAAPHAAWVRDVWEATAWTGRAVGTSSPAFSLATTRSASDD